MGYKLVISNKILTKVKGIYKDDAGVAKSFNFELEQDRISQDELAQVVADKSENASDFIKRTTHGWRNQRLVLDDSDQPAEFSSEALAVLLQVSGMGGFCFQAYIEQVLVTAKN